MLSDVFGLTYCYSWEMSTIGHPLSDLSNFLVPWTITANSDDVTRNSIPTYRFESRLPGLPTKAQCIAWYREVAGWDPGPDLAWSDAFAIFRGSIICQGIAARYAVRQASSAAAYEVGQQMFPYAQILRELVGKLQDEKEGNVRANL